MSRIVELNQKEIEAVTGSLGKEGNLQDLDKEKNQEIQRLNAISKPSAGVKLLIFIFAALWHYQMCCLASYGKKYEGVE